MCKLIQHFAADCSNNYILIRILVFEKMMALIFLLCKNGKLSRITLHQKCAFVLD